MVEFISFLILIAAIFYHYFDQILKMWEIKQFKIGVLLNFNLQNRLILFLTSFFYRAPKNYEGKRLINLWKWGRKSWDAFHKIKICFELNSGIGNWCSEIWWDSRQIHQTSHFWFIIKRDMWRPQIITVFTRHVQQQPAGLYRLRDTLEASERAWQELVDSNSLR